MFEKEAEEYREEWQNKGYYFVSQEMEQIELDDIVDATFKDGAEFGYNKANKWHYVKDGYLPKDNQLVLLYRENPNGANVALTYWYKSYVNDKVIAWKEIVLPELKESE